MSIALQLAINILIPTALFGLLAAGFSVFYAVSRVQHLAIGASVSAAGYTLYALLGVKVSLPLGILAAVTIAILIGLLCNFLVYERLVRRRWFSTLVALISSVMLLLALQSILLIFFGSQPKAVSMPIAVTRYEVLGASITPFQLISLAIAAVLFVALVLYLKYSRLGVAIRATTDHAEVAEIMGVNTRRLRYFTMIVTSTLAGIAGVLIAIEYNLEPYASNLHAIRAYARTIVGGIGSIPGALVGGLITDAAENLGSFFFLSGYEELYSFVLVFLFLIFRPQGIFGSRKD